MWAAIFFGLLVVVSCFFYLVVKRLRREIAVLARSREKIQLEENRVFDFLHSLGEAFSGELVGGGDLHRIIVESAVRVLEAEAGALYLIDREGLVLLPSFISKNCPPLMEVPPHILRQAETAPVALQSFLRLHAVESGEGILGSVWRDSEEALYVGEVLEGRRLQT